MLQSSRKLSVLIVGCGNIAGGYDINLQRNQYPYTHMGAYVKDSRFEVIGCVDPDLKTAETFSKQWNIKRVFSSLEEILLLDEKIDVISICSPTTTHYSNVMLAINLQPKLIFCEKPMSQDLHEAEELIARCKMQNIILAVNYSRRWDPQCIQLKEDILNNKYGQLRAINVFYNKGLLNNGTHLIDLMLYLLDSLYVKSVLCQTIDFYDEDPSVAVFFQSDTGVPVHFGIGHANDYSLFEINFIFSEGILSMLNGGINWSFRKAIQCSEFIGYKDLLQEIKFPGQINKCMLNAVDNIYNAIENKQKLNSDVNNAYKVHQIYQEIRSKQ